MTPFLLSISLEDGRLMQIEWIPLLSFVVITTFTPGPNNISSASMGVVYGFHGTVNYLFGIASGFFLVMIACAYLSSALLTIMPFAQSYLRWIGAAYILWLAGGIFRADYSFSESGPAPNTFSRGLMLQLFNPKVAVYGLTLFSTFLSTVSDHPVYLIVFAMGFALTSFASIITWALCGAAIKTRLKSARVRKGINTVLSAMLIYTAVSLSGLATLF